MFDPSKVQGKVDVAFVDKKTGEILEVLKVGGNGNFVVVAEGDSPGDVGMFAHCILPFLEAALISILNGKNKIMQKEGMLKIQEENVRKIDNDGYTENGSIVDDVIKKLKGEMN